MPPPREAPSSPRSSPRPLPPSPRPAQSPRPLLGVDIFSPTFKVFEGEDGDYDDMIKMNEVDFSCPVLDFYLLGGQLTVQSILQNLAKRFARDQIYTNIGDIVISVNPYKPLAGLYTSAVMQKYALGDRKTPHVFSVAADAFNDMVACNRNQTVSFLFSLSSFLFVCRFWPPVNPEPERQRRPN